MTFVRRRSALATLVFLAFTTPFGIAAHLVSELAGLGWHDDAEVLFSPRHGYLAALAVASFGVLLAALLAIPRRYRRARVAGLIDGLPYKGRGPGFIAVAFFVQFVFFAASQLGEGCPLCGGDVVVGVAAAAFAALLGSLAVALGKRRILDCALALVFFLTVALPAALPTLGQTCSRGTLALATRRSPFSFRYRPPPHAAT